MLVEIPSFKRCCCCLPLRRGILAFGYLNLLITVFFGILQLLLWLTYYSAKTHPVAMYRGVVIETHMFFVIGLHILDAVFNVILIVGAHMKNKKLFGVYYYYQLATMIANFFALLVTFSDITQISDWAIWSTISELAVAFLGFVIQIYLLLLIYSELQKDKYEEGRSSFDNHIAEVFVEPPALREDRRSLL